MLELEKTYLAKSLPSDLQNHKSQEILDIYLPKDSRHPTLRLRKKGDAYRITKKELVDEDNKLILKEQTIPLTEEEFNTLKKAEGKILHKIRYFYPHNGHVLQFALYQGDLKGLVMIDVEFESEEQMHSFITPEFCLIDTKEANYKEFLAGGMLCGKSYENIAKELEKLSYQKL